MPVIRPPAGPTHTLPGTRFTSLATPSRGTRESSLWRVEIDEATAATPHTLTREEVFLVVRGTAAVRVGTDESRAAQGDAIVVPAGEPFTLANAGDATLELLCWLPVGGQAQIGDGPPFTPPWAE